MSHDANYIVGDIARLSVVFSSPVTLAAVDPGNLTLKIRKPDKTLVTLIFGTDAALIKDSAGHYRADIDLPAAGVWAWRWEATGSNAGAAESQLTVKASRVL